MSTTSSPLDDFIYFCCSSLVYYVDYFIFLCLYRSQDYEINYLYFHWSCYIFSHCRLGPGPAYHQCWLLWYLPKTSFQQNKSQVCSQSRKLSRHAVCGVCLKLFCLCEVNTRSAPSPPYWPVTSVLIITLCWHSPVSRASCPRFIGLWFLFVFCLSEPWRLSPEWQGELTNNLDSTSHPFYIQIFSTLHTFCICQLVWREVQLSYTCCRSSFSADSVASCTAERTHSRTTFVANTFFPNMLTSPSLLGWSQSPSWTVHDWAVTWTTTSSQTCAHSDITKFSISYPGDYSVPYNVLKMW